MNSSLRVAAEANLSRRSLLVGAAASMTVSACDATAIGASQRAHQIDLSLPIPVALMLPGGGGDAGRNKLSRNLENAARLAASDLQSVEIDLRVYQTAASETQAAALAARAINDGARIVVGPLFADSARAVGSVAAQAGVNVLSFSNNPEVAGGNVFLLGPMFEPTAERLLSYAVSQGKGRFMLLSEQNQAGRVAEEAVLRATQRTGASLVASESYPFSERGIVNALPRIALSARSSGAQTIFLTANSSGALPLLAELLPQHGVSPRNFQFLGLTRWDIPPETLQLSGLQGGWFALPDPTLTAPFEARYRAAHGERPNAVAALAYDGIAAIGVLAKRRGKAPFSAASITHRAGFAGVNGIFRLLPDGSNERGMAIAEIRGRSRSIISHAPRSFDGVGS